jgi:hypothetical protein
MPLLLLLAIAAPVRVLVHDAAAAPELAPQAHHLSEELLLALGKLDQLVVVGETELKVMLAHESETRDLDECLRGEECLAKLERAVDAEKLLRAHLARWGNGFMVTLSLSDLQSASLERGESCQGDAFEEVERCATQLAVELLAGRAPPVSGGFRLPGGATKLAVLDLESYGAPPDLTKNLTQLLALELKKFDGVQVISRDEVMAALEYESSKQVVQCTSDIACLIEIGGALGTDWLVLGAVGKLEETFDIHLKLLSASNAEVKHRVAETFSGPPQHLAQAVRFAVWRLMGKPIDGTGSLAIVVDAPEVSLVIDGAPATTPVQVPAGKHSLALAAADFQRLSHEFYVEADRTTTLHPELIPLPTPWYRQWWPWAIMGAAVAAVVTTSVVVAVERPDEAILKF